MMTRFQMKGEAQIKARAIGATMELIKIPLALFIWVKSYAQVPSNFN